jgi:two-component system LytT family response regulator
VIKALIIDDEAAAAQVLQLMLERYIPEITDVRIATKIAEAKTLVHSFEPHLVFQDIVMPEKNGFELLSEIKKINFEIIFTTAFDEYAIRAIRFSALDYLLKPIDADELKLAVARFTEKRKTKQEADVLFKNLLSNLEQKKETKFKLAIPTLTGSLFLTPSEIVRLEGEGNYTRFFMHSGQKHISSKTIKEYADILTGHNFIRIHKSHCVNKSYVVQYLKEGAVVLEDKTLLPVSRQRKQEVATQLRQQLPPGLPGNE